MWGRYGLWWYDPTPWYDPWYDPFFMYGYDGYFGSYGSYRIMPGYGERSSRDDEPRAETGSIRLRVNPDKAKVYIDGVLQGTVNDFNGLHSHLDVPGGPHQLELRADGYVTLKDEIIVEPGQTQTYRGALKKSGK